MRNLPQYDSGLFLLLHEELHWLDVIDRVRYKLALLAYRSLHGTAPQYLTSLLTSASEVTGRQYLRSAAQQKLIVPRCRRKTFGVFGGKSVSLEWITCTGQSERCRADFSHIQASFEDLLLHVITDVSYVQHIRDFLVMRYINVRFTYLLNYSPKKFWECGSWLFSQKYETKVGVSRCCEPQKKRQARV